MQIMELVALGSTKEKTMTRLKAKTKEMFMMNPQNNIQLQGIVMFGCLDFGFECVQYYTLR